MARVCEGEGADGLSLINAVQGLWIDVARRRTALRNGLGGLSGPAILPIALRMVWQARRAVSIPICGIGGIASGEDAVAFLLCGASAVQVGTLPTRTRRGLNRRIEAYRRHGVAGSETWSGRSTRPLGIAPPPETGENQAPGYGEGCNLSSLFGTDSEKVGSSPSFLSLQSG
jgi:hypothetical protein